MFRQSVRVTMTFLLKHFMVFEMMGGYKCLIKF